MLFFYLFAISWIVRRSSRLLFGNSNAPFIAIAGSYDQQIIYCRLRNIPCRKEIVSTSPVGFYEGVEGIFVRVKGDRRVVVSIQGYGGSYHFYSSLSYCSDNRRIIHNSAHCTLLLTRFVIHNL